MPDVLRVGVEPSRVELTPGGEPAVVEVRIFNGTEIIDEFTVEAIGTGEWLDVAPASVRLFPDKEGVAGLTLAIPPGKLVPAGERTVGIQVTSTSTPSLSSVDKVVVGVTAIAAEVAMTLQPQVVRGGTTGDLTVTLSNGGNAPLHLTMSGSEPEGATRFGFTPQQVEVPMGGTTTVGLRVRAPRAFFGTERQRSLTVRAEGTQPPLTASATFVQAPRFTEASLRILRIVLTLLAAAALIMGAFGTWLTANGTYTGVELDYEVYAKSAFDVDLRGPEEVLSEDVVFLASAGFVAIFFGVLVALGALTRTGKLTRVAGLLILIVILALFAVLFVAPNAVESIEVGRGAIAAAAGAVLAIVAGSIGT